MVLEKKGIWGCEIVQICSIIVNNFVMVKVFYSNNTDSSSRIERVNINHIEFI